MLAGNCELNDPQESIKCQVVYSSKYDVGVRAWLLGEAVFNPGE